MIVARTSVTVGLLIAILSGSAVAEELADADLKAMRAAARSYADAWLTNDADSIMATFVNEPRISKARMRLVTSGFRPTRRLQR
jgi:hypothetical protein